MDVFADIGTPARKFTSPILAMRGTYGLSATQLPYFISTMRLRDLQTQLTIVEDLPTDLTTGWKLQELYQREIDWKRVENEIVKEYLRAANKLKFFNAITVALLPRAKDGPILTSFSRTEEMAASSRPQEVPATFDRIDLGSVDIYSHTTAPLSYLRWDTDRAIAAVIDGQHRVAALRKYASSPLTTVQLDTQVPVIFLILDPKAGFDFSKLVGTDSGILHVVRELFIDLNKHAEEVSRARQILMDDRDIPSIGLRSLLAERAVEYLPEERRIPLGVVDWQSEKAKFEKGPFVTTVVNLKICIEDILDLKAPRDPTDPEQIDDYLESLENALGIDDLIGREPRFKGMILLKRHVEAEYKSIGRPLENIPSLYLPVAEHAFRVRWKPYLGRVFLDFSPYAEVLKLALQYGALDGEWAKVAALPERAREKYWDDKEQGAKGKLIDEPNETIESFKKDKWAFFSVFQKGLLRATAYLVRHEDLLAERGSQLPRRQQLAAEWLELLNYLDQKGYLQKESKLPDGTLLWSGITLRDNKTISWSGPAVNATTAMLLLWFFRRRDKRKHARTFLAAIKKPSNADKFPDFVGRQKIATTSHLGRLYGALEKLPYGIEAAKTELREKRLLDIIELVEPKEITSDATETGESETDAPVKAIHSDDTD